MDRATDTVPGPASSGPPAPYWATQDEWQRTLAGVVEAEFEPHYRRQHRRYAVTGEVKAVGEMDGQPFKKTWPLLEASAEGLTAKATSEFLVGTSLILQIHLSNSSLTIRGRIKHCTQTLGGYKLGIHLQFSSEGQSFPAP